MFSNEDIGGEEDNNVGSRFSLSFSLRRKSTTLFQQNHQPSLLSCACCSLRSTTNILEEMKQKNFKKFEEYCCLAYNIIRHNAHILINLLMLMIVGEIEQLNDDSIKYLIRALRLNKSDEEAAAEFKKLIKQAVTTYFRMFDNVAHNLMDKFKKGSKKKKKGESSAGEEGTLASGRQSLLERRG